MAGSHCARWWSWLGIPGLLMLIPASLPGAEKPRNVPAGQTVGLFAALESGQVEVRIVPKNSKELKVLVTNKTEEPLTVRMPEVFAAVPIMAQFGQVPGRLGQRQNPGTNMNPGTNPNQAKSQGLGSGVNQGANAFSIAPEKVGQWKAPAVCLEHNKQGPHASIPYEIRPIEKLTSSAEVAEVCRLLAQGDVSQHIAQAAAWYLNNGMSWEKLASQESRSILTASPTSFSKQEIREAQQLVAKVTKTVKTATKSVESAKPADSARSAYAPDSLASD